MREMGETVGGGEPIVPDDKDWTWTLARPCPECGFAAGAIPAGEVAARVTAYTAPWSQVLNRPDVRQRPHPATWSALEYACHVRDVCALFAQRATSMLSGDRPTFANWDQDRTALEHRYAEQDPATVSLDLTAAAAELSSAYAAVSGRSWGMVGDRSDGSQFTVLSLGRYGLHDLAHHLWDVGAEVS
ncbi:MAG: DinB family protein [Ornithinibacter sp.]